MELAEVTSLRNLDKTRTNILQAGLKSFVSLGYGATITDIAKCAKMSKQRVLYHFKNTEEILLELVYVWGELGRLTTIEYLASSVASSSKEKVIAISEATFIWMEKYPEMARLTPVFFQAMNHSLAIKKSFKGTLDTGVERIAGLLGGRSGNAAALRRARGIHSVIVGTALYVIGQNAWEELETYRGVSRQAIEKLLEG
jgi:AcrR family transcriptional regulator